LALIHDISKFYPTEYALYQYEFFGSAPNDRHDPVTKSRAHFAFKMHYKRNKHHWQYWVTDWKRRTAQEMPEKYVREMVADWMGAGRAYAGTWDISHWFNRHFHEAILDFDTRYMVYNILADLGYAVYDPQHCPGIPFPKSLSHEEFMVLHVMSHGDAEEIGDRYINFEKSRRWIVCSRRENLLCQSEGAKE
jgi:hypothetical protein